MNSRFVSVNSSVAAAGEYQRVHRRSNMLNRVLRVGGKVEVETVSFKETCRELKKQLKALLVIFNKYVKVRILGIPLGDYRKPPIAIGAYKVDKMPWYNYGKDFSFAGCGAMILAQLTGASPYEIRRFVKPLLAQVYKDPENEYDKDVLLSGKALPAPVMALFLELHKIHMYPISLRDICPRPMLIDNHITKDHVLLTCSHVAQNTKSWCVYHQGKCWHNVDITDADCYDILNNPPEEMYLLFSNAWKVDNLEEVRQELGDSGALS